MRTRLAFNLVAWMALAGEPAQAIEVRVQVGGCLPGPVCGWSMEVHPDRGAVVEVYPKGHLSRRFILSRRQLADLQDTLRREDFFSLPDSVGVLIPDGSGATIVVKDGSRQRTVKLDVLPYELRPVWRSDVGSVGRTFRVCEYLRLLTGVEEAMHCPGVTDEAQPKK